MTCITTIEEQVSQVIAFSQSVANPQVHAIIEKWHEAKMEFIMAWKDYIYELPEPVTFYLSADEKRRRFNEFIDAVDNTYGNSDLTEFLDSLSIDEIFDNHLQRDWYLDGQNKIVKGTKVSKAFKYFESNEEILRKLQDQLSVIIQEDKITGTLCLSVHPLDYLSVSENIYHWRSCHALDGDYRSGNLQYMVDKSTIVCYLRGADGQKLPNFPADVPWNSKKWRMLLFLSDNRQAMFAGRQYPFFSPTAMDIVQQVLLDSLGKRVRAWTPWYNDFIKQFPRAESEYNNESDNWLNDRYISMHGQMFPMRKLIIEPKKPLFFNDLTDSSFYYPYYSWNRYAGTDCEFHIGDEAPCPCCNGRSIVNIPEDMRCQKCYEEWLDGDNPSSEFVYCECCDRRILRSDAYFIDGDEAILCEYCYTDCVNRCEKCEKEFYTSAIKYDRETGKYLCPYCRGDSFKPTPLPIVFDDEDWELLPF